MTYPASPASLERTRARQFSETVQEHTGFGSLAPFRAPKVVTSFVNPPIPARCCDWQAFFEGQEEGPVGYGATEDEAREDLQTIVEDRDEYLREKQDAERARYGRNSGE